MSCPPDKPQAPDQPAPHLINCHDMEWACRQAAHCFLVDGKVSSFHAAVHHAMQRGIVRKALGIDCPDLVDAVADYLPGNQIRDGGLCCKQLAVTFNVMRIVDVELPVDDIAGTGMDHAAI
jgi:hypothetical protein